MGLDADDQVQVTRLRAAQAGLAFTGDAHAQALSSAGRNLDLDRAHFPGLYVLDRERALGPVEGFLERDLDRLLEILAFARRAADTRSTTSGTSEQLLEQPAEILGFEVEAAGHIPAGRAPRIR